MSDSLGTNPDFGKFYRVVGIRQDGSRAVVRDRMPLTQASFTRCVIDDARIFADVCVEPESGDNVPSPDWRESPLGP